MKRQKFLAVLLSAALAFTPVINVMAEENAVQATETDGTESQKSDGATGEENGTEENGSSVEKGETTGEVGQASGLTNKSNSKSVVISQDGSTGSGNESDSQETENQSDVQVYSNEEKQPTGTVGGYIPSELDYNTPVYYGNGISTYDAIPAKYPEADDPIAAIKEKYPVNRNQNPYGTCWAFSSLGMAEFDLINKGIFTKDNIDLSELQLAYFAYNFVTDPLGGTTGDIAKYYNENASVNYLDYGGNYELSSRRLAQWIGATNESTVPYELASNVLTSGLDDQYAYDCDKVHLENMSMINIKSNQNDVKEQIMKHGAVGVMYYHNDNGYHYINNAYYDADKTGGGHAVMVVGWDDNYSKNNFRTYKESYTPSQNGAWLVRNSWGTLQSYFWMSYETVSLADTAYAFDFSSDNKYDNNYQLDGGTTTTVMGVYTPYSVAANVFETKSQDGVSAETLKAVSLSFTHYANVNYTIEIYTDLESNDPSSGTKQEEATTSGTTTYAGIYTIPLKKELQLQPNTKFAVVVKMDAPYIDLETGQGVETEDHKIVWDNYVNSPNGKSYYGNKSGYFWQWGQYGNFCIKAFTCNNKDFGEELKGYTAILNGVIDLNFKMDIASDSELLKNPDASYMEFTVNGNTTQVKISEAKREDNLYVFPCPVVAKEMTMPVEARFVSLAGEKGKTYTYTVKEYADEILDSKNNYTEEAKNLVKAMLNYGAYAQTYFGFNTEKLANESLSEDEKEASLKQVDFSQYAGIYNGEDTVPGISYYGSGLNLNTETNVNNYFIVEEGHSIEEYVFMVNTNKVVPEKKIINGQTFYLIEIKGIKATHLDQTTEITVKQKDHMEAEGMKMVYSPFSYCYAVSKNLSEKTNLVNATKSIYWYWDSAKKYVETL